LTGSAFTPVELPLPALETGLYSLTVTGRTLNGLVDTLTLPVRVVDSFLTKQQLDFYLLEEGIGFQGAAQGLTTLTFSNYERGRYLNSVLQMASVEGNRIDQKLAAILGQRLIQEYFPQIKGERDLPPVDLMAYQTNSGGLALLPYGEADPELSGKIACLGSLSFDTFQLKNYFYQIVNDPKESRERSIASLCGLAALGEPVLAEMELMAGSGELTVKEQLYLILGLIEAGAEQQAASLLVELLQSKGERAGSYFRINTGQDQDDILEATAMAAAAAAPFNLPEERGLADYVLDNRGTDILTYLEQLLFLGKILPRLSGEPVSFNYMLHGKKETVTLKAGEVYSLPVKAEELPNLKFLDIQGQVGVTCLYEVPYSPAPDAGKNEVLIKRSYSVVGVQGRQFKGGDLVKIQITYEFGAKSPSGMYRIVDHLPAGLKIVSRPYERGLHDLFLGYPVEVRGQKAVFLVHGPKNGSFHYYARIVNRGEFKGEPALFQHVQSGQMCSLTGEDRVEIR
ncbi:MAG TPA: alpha-2-macroglobulin, partial [Clostridia bacterium]|nr:alpha-2-macroglobulin [Clostridia bacterium]